MSVRRIRHIYDRTADRYESGMALTDALVRRGRQEVGEEAAGTVLEIGIGTGLSLAWYGASVNEVVAVDVSMGMLEHCRRRAQATGRPVELLLADAEALPFAARTFDTVVFSLCLCTIPDPSRALAEALRVARPNAAILCLEHVRSDNPLVGLLQDALTPFTEWLEADHFNRRTESAVRAAGVEIVSVRRWALGILTVVRGRAPASD